MNWSLRCASSEVRCFPTYDGLNNVHVVLDAFEMEVPEKQCFQALDYALCTMPV